MRKQVRTFEEHMVCEVCGRTMLKGERTEPYLTPSRPPRPQEGGRRFRRARKAAASLARPPADGQVEPPDTQSDGARPRARKARFRDPRHVRAVPTNAQL